MPADQDHDEKATPVHSNTSFLIETDCYYVCVNRMSSDKKPVSAQIFKLKVSKVNTSSLAAYYGQLEIIEDVCIKGRNMRSLLSLNSYLIAFA